MAEHVSDAELYTYLLHRKRSNDIGRGERIGAVTCISGLVALLTALRSRIESFCRTYPDLYNVLHNISRSCYLLSDLQSDLKGIQLFYGRASSITADRLVTSFTHAVVLLDNLETVIRKLTASYSVWDETGVEDHLAKIAVLDEKLSLQRMIWQMMIDTLRSTSDEPARLIADSLAHQIDQLAANDMALKLRVRTIDQQVNQLSVVASPESLTRSASRAAYNEIHEDEFGGEVKPHGFVLPRPDFIEDFERSQIQRRASLRSGRMSFHTAVMDSRVWIGLSSITLQQLPTVSAIALPIRISDLAHGHWYTEYRWLEQPSSSKYTAKLNSVPTGGDDLFDKAIPPAVTTQQAQPRRESQRWSQQPTDTTATWSSEPRSRMSGSKVIRYLRRRSQAAQR
ncbi:hypothetical protein DOTSEDRAFT_56512 [Dothistroma septosporum NZE10]|uniref:Fungal N-terminal domain-containing protein n=1 Tax=Dothistroma septosporum (strain NZE10 / CBS 128990) TaxID=675120 RepID=N1PD70_DOTSN|nr:hypothetical protein DOTSEDRAFT_56512 [Dothistroma septosporum NZE10]